MAPIRRLDLTYQTIYSWRPLALQIGAPAIAEEIDPIAYGRAVETIRKLVPQWTRMSFVV
jgi:hypothetical protein